MTNTEFSQPTGILQPIIIEEPRFDAAALSQSGNWGETQVIEQLREASICQKDPGRLLSGQTQVIGFRDPVKGSHGRLVVPKPSLRRRLRRMLGYLTK